MIEMIYKGSNKDEKDEDRKRLPKNVRQIGEAGKGKRIYLEDYAVTYLHQVEAAVLLGEVWEKEGCKYIFIHGAIKVDNPSFGDEIWEDVYREAREYFEDSEILGWAMQVPEQPLVLSKEMNNIYKAHFDREDAVLLFYEPCEKEDALFTEENGTLRKAAGYYIYYDKNKSMQEYMVSKNEGKSVEQESTVTDRAIKNFRKIAEEKKETNKAEKEIKQDKTVKADKAVKLEKAEQPVKKEKEKIVEKQPKTSRFLYAASTFLVLTILIIGVTMINNYDKMKNMELTLSDMAKGTEPSVEANASKNVKSQKEKNTEKQVVKDETNQTESDQASAKQTEAMSETQPQQVTKETAAQETAALDKGAAEIPKEDAKAQENQEADLGASAAETDAQAAAAVHTEQASYTVKVGDTLADICRMYYGNTDKLDEICALNGITDPNCILLGQKIKLP